MPLIQERIYRKKQLISKMDDGSKSIIQSTGVLSFTTQIGNVEVSKVGN